MVHPEPFEKQDNDMSQATAQKTPSTLTNADLKDMSNAVRALAMDAVQKANSGHPGMPMGMADVATVLFTKFLKFDPKTPEWPNRDRFILSAGHGSMLLYAINYLTGYEKITLDQIKNFRQLGAITAGHPEVEHDAGIEMTTGPLGQGISTAVGFALAERILNARHGDAKVNHFTYVIASDGDLMEGISHEAGSLAGHQKLSKLIVLYDDNGICIDGKTDLTFIDNTPKRFEAYGWDVQTVDGHNFDEIETAIAKAQTTATPSLICCKTKIGFGAPTKENSASSHGSPLGAEEIAGARKNLGWAYGEFEIPDSVLANWRSVGTKATGGFSDTTDIAKTIEPIIRDLKKSFATEKPKKATRQTSGMVLEKLIPALPAMIGGSADLTGSNNTKVAASKIIDSKDYSGNYINYGVREHGMAAAMNGMALYGNLIPYAGTFLQFADYSRPSIRLGALMKQRVIHVMTHDSIGLGEDGPTHQPVEHLSALRAIPNTYVFRPCDGVETAECWELALKKHDGQSVMALTRQNLPTLRDDSAENKSARGAYILKETGGEPEITLFATGSEVEIALGAYEHFAAKGKAVRLVSCPCLDLFWEQDGDYIMSFLCNKSLKIAVEAGIRQSWDRLIGGHSLFIGMDGFGASAPAEVLYKHFGITSEAIINKVEKILEKRG